jgi:hypothetical protein
MKKIFVTLMAAVALLAPPLYVFAASETATNGTPAMLPKPEIFELQPRGIQLGTTNRIKIIGTNLFEITEVKIHGSSLKTNLLNALHPYESELRKQERDGSPAGLSRRTQVKTEGGGGGKGEFFAPTTKDALKAKLLKQPEPATNIAWVEITAPPGLPRGSYEISVKNTNAESAKVKIHVDDLPQLFQATGENRSKTVPMLKLPVSFWGVIDQPGTVDEIAFEASKGESLVFDLAAKSVGSKANLLLTVQDENGSVLASNNGFDGDDPLMQFRIPTRGKYHVRIADKTDAGSKDHFYRISIGSFPVVFGFFPLGVPANKKSDVQLLGYNLAQSASVHIEAGAPGEIEVPLDQKWRTRRLSRIIVNDGPELVEIEPNDSTTNATRIAVDSVMDGRIESRSAREPDVDTYEFEARKNEILVIETDAARRGSPIDTKIQVLRKDGKPVERLLLQAVRDSHVTFRSIDSNSDDLRVENWQEMELNQLMYLQGEVCKIFRMPQGPDSGFQFYSAGGKRRDYFDTSPVAHALDESAYIVEPHPLGSQLEPNGLPVFTVNYENDDDADRSLGPDSRLLFTPPADGTYLVRVTDSRAYGGERFNYRLLVRHSKPGFRVTLTGTDLTVNPGAGKDFTVTANRIDGFDGDIRVETTGLPEGFTALTPLVIQAGHLIAKGSINTSADAPAPTEAQANAVKITATAVIHGEPVIEEVNNFGKIKLGQKPKLFVALEPYDEKITNFVERSVSDKPLEITIAPGQSIPAWLKIKRNGHEDLVTFTVESLPHGVIVDNIGLNGVLIPKGQDARRIFLTAAKWVPDVDRLCFAKANQADSPTSLPLLLHVRKSAANLSQAK